MERFLKSPKNRSEIKTGINRRDCRRRIRGISKYERFPAFVGINAGILSIKNSGGILAPLKESRNAPFSSVRETLVKSIRFAVQIDTEARRILRKDFLYRNIFQPLSSHNPYIITVQFFDFSKKDSYINCGEQLMHHVRVLKKLVLKIIILHQYQLARWRNQ